MFRSRLFSNSLGDISVFGLFGISIDLIVILAVTFAGIYFSIRVKRRADHIQETTGRPANHMAY